MHNSKYSHNHVGKWLQQAAQPAAVYVASRTQGRSFGEGHRPQIDVQGATQIHHKKSKIEV